MALCLVLTHPAINCVSTAAVCIGQIESRATGPFCFVSTGMNFQTSSFPLIPTMRIHFFFFFTASLFPPFFFSVSRILLSVLSSYFSLLVDQQIQLAKLDGGIPLLAALLGGSPVNNICSLYHLHPCTLPSVCTKRGMKDRD